MELKPIERVFFNPLLHTYTLDGTKNLKGVTTLLKDHGLSPSEYADIPDKILMDAAKRGTAIHELLEKYDNGEPAIPYNVVNDEGVTLLDKQTMAKSLKEYAKLSQKVVASELLISDFDCVASSIDKVVATENPDEFILKDIKTSSSIHKDTYSWQLSIYAYLFEKCYPGAKVVDLVVIHIKDGKVKEVPTPRIPSEEVQALLNAEKLGLQYVNEPLRTETIGDVIGDAEITLLAQSVAMIDQLEERVKELNDLVAQTRARLTDYMISNNLDNLCGGGLEIKLKAGYQRKSVDSKKLESKYPDIYEECIKVSEVKPTIIIKSNVKD